MTKPQKEIQKAARAFARGEFDKELAQDMDKKHEFPLKTWEKAADLGFVGIHFDEKHSGGGMGLLENTLIAEEFCRRDSTIGMALTSAGFAAECLVRFAEEELKSKFLPPVAEGQMLSGGAFTEPGRGADISDLKTSAVKQNNEWVLNGTKICMVNGGVAGFYVVLCSTDPDAEATRGSSMFLVEADRKGLTIKNTGDKLGARMIASAEIILENVRVATTHLIGKEGRGYDQAQQFYTECRLLIAAQSLGIALGAFDRALEYVKGREQFGKKIAQFQITRHKFADMETKIEMARLLTYKTAWDFDKGRKSAHGAAMAKIVSARTALEVADEAIQLHGGYGYMTEYDVERFYRDAKIAELYCGNKEALKDIIGKAAIGKIK
ncbi:MAG: acyl-CoA dehydrogenase family protein [Deltaproteobacteria bacterium]|nr:acyl-CoA dehydrogenase family protein [Deltaproteobacteria bacterium]